MLLARKIKYQHDGKIKSEKEDLILVQCTEKSSSIKTRFSKLFNNKFISNEFLKNFNYSEKPFKFQINNDFLKPKKSVLDSWILNSIPYSFSEDSEIKNHEIPCFSATRFFSGRASAMRYHILPLIVNRNYDFKSNIDPNKINKPYFNNNQQIFWKEN